MTSGRSTECWQPGQVKDQWLPFRFRGAGLAKLLSIDVTVLKDNRRCSSSCSRLYYPSGESLLFPGRVLVAHLVMWLALGNIIHFCSKAEALEPLYCKLCSFSCFWDYGSMSHEASFSLRLWNIIMSILCTWGASFVWWCLKRHQVWWITEGCNAGTSGDDLSQ